MSAPRRRGAVVFRWILALVAIAFVAWMVPLRDRCWDARSPASTRVSVSRALEPSPGSPGGSSGSCVLHLRTGDVRISAEQCTLLRCEPGLASTWTHARPGAISALFAFYALGSLAWAARWRALLGFAGIDLPLSEVWRISIEAQAGGILLPGGIGGDALRIASVAARPSVTSAKPPLAIVIASVLLDRAVGLAVVAGMAATLAFAWGGFHAGPLATILATLPFAFVGGIAVLRRAPLQRMAWLVEGHIGGIVRPVLEYLRHPLAPRAITVATVLSVLVAGIQFATIRGIVFALGGVPSAEKWVYVGIAMAFVVSAVPALPGAWGTADAAYVYFFGLAGLPAGTSLAVCLLYRLFWYLSGVVGAVLHVARRRPFAAQACAGPAEEPPA